MTRFLGWRAGLTAATVAVELVFIAPHAQTIPASAITGVWTLNTELSDAPPDPGGRGERGDRAGRGGAPGGRGRGGIGGGFGGPGGRGGGRDGGRGGGPAGGRGGNREAMERMRDAMNGIMEPAARLTITPTETMVIITTGEGRTTRLSTDNKKIKDESTGIERKSRWQGSTLMSEISGAGPTKIVESYAASETPRRLTVTLEFGGGDDRRPPIHRVYDIAPQEPVEPER